MKNTILSYKDWARENAESANALDPYNAYLEYVRTWYEGTFNGRSTADLTADEYRKFLLTLRSVSSDNNIAGFLNNLDHTNLDELEAGIPYFAKKLKNIAKYISEKRDDAKYANIDYSFIDSNIGIETEVYRLLLELFIGSSTLSDDDLDDSINNVAIEVVELYDDNAYLDKSPNKSASDYFDIEDNSAYYGKCEPEFMSWAIESGFNELYSNNDTLNPPISGDNPLSAYIGYNPTTEGTKHFQGQLSNKYMGEKHYYLSGDDGEPTSSMGVYSTADTPWNNLSNRYFPTIAVIPLVDLLYSKYDKGGFMIPSKIGMPMALGLNKFYSPSAIDIVGDKMDFPDPSLYSNGYSFTNEYQDSPIVYHSYLNWIDTRANSGRGRGILANKGQYQEMSPYQTYVETTSISNLGIYNINDKSDPWYLSKDNIWEDDATYPPDFRNIYDIDKWYNTLLSLSGEEYNWGVDIFGNNYGLYKNIPTLFGMFLSKYFTHGGLFIRSVDGALSTYSDYFKDSIGTSLDGIFIEELRTMNVYNDIVVLEDKDGTVAIQKIFIDDDGKYAVDVRNSINTSIIEASLSDYESFEHYYDDRTNELYVIRYDKVPTGIIEFIIYKYSDGRLIGVYDTITDTSNEITAFRSTVSFTDLEPTSSSIVIDPLANKLYLTYIHKNTYPYTNLDEYIIVHSFTLGSKFEIDEIIVVAPSPNVVVSAAARSPLHLVGTSISNNNLTLSLEKFPQSNKYLEVIEL